MQFNSSVLVVLAFQTSLAFPHPKGVRSGKLNSADLVHH